MSWEPINQDGPEAIDSLGLDLHCQLSCPVRYCAACYGKPVFECECGKMFPRYAVEAAFKSGDWSQIIERHQEVCCESC